MVAMVVVLLVAARRALLTEDIMRAVMTARK
jgi:hypothetical protein